jgi:hypothetical protein
VLAAYDPAPEEFSMALSSQNGSSSQTEDQAAASLDAARSTLCRLVLGLSYDEARVLMRLAVQMRTGIERWGPLSLGSAAVAYVRETREDIEEGIVYLTCVLAAGRCA